MGAVGRALVGGGVVAAILVFQGCATQPPDPLFSHLQPAAGFEVPLPAEIQTLDAGKMLVRVFTLSGPGFVRVEWAAAQDHRLNVWLLDEEQYRRAKAGAPMDSGNYMHAELYKSQGMIAASAPGRGLYYAAFANPNGHPVRLVSRIVARR